MIHLQLGGHHLVQSLSSLRLCTAMYDVIYCTKWNDVWCMWKNYVWWHILYVKIDVQYSSYQLSIAIPALTISNNNHIGTVMYSTLRSRRNSTKASESLLSHHVADSSSFQRVCDATRWCFFVYRKGPIVCDTTVHFVQFTLVLSTSFLFVSVAKCVKLLYI